jgi:predicted permease
MKAEQRLRRYFWSLLSRFTVDEEVAAELEHHVEMRTRELMARGMNEREARDAAIARFGDLSEVSRRCRRIARARERDQLLFVWHQELKQDLVFAVRQLRKAPVLSAVVVLTIAIAIAANTTVFSVSKAVVLEPLPFPEPDRLVRIQEMTPEGDPFSVSDPTFIDLREQTRSFVHLAAVSGPFPSFNLQRSDEPIRCSGVAATGSLFSVLAIEPVIGRVFSSEEEQPGATSRVVLLSNDLWQRHFASAPEILGQTVTMDDEGWTVIGVMPDRFEFLNSPDVWVPFAPNPESGRGEHRLEVFGRLRAGVSMEQMRTDLTAVAGRLGDMYPESNGGWTFYSRKFSDWLIGPRARRTALVLTAAVALIMLLACANVSNLMISQVTTRYQEIGTRAALGASRGRMVRQLLTESILMAFFGAVLGLLLAIWATSAIRNFASFALPRLDEVAIDTPVLLFTLVISLAAGALSGVVPAVRITGGRLAGALTSHRHTSTRGARRVHDALVVSEVSLAVMLLIGAGLLSRSYAELNSTDPGFVAERVLTVQLTLPETRYPEMSQETAQFYTQVIEEVEGIPGVVSAGATMIDPFRGPRPANKVARETAVDTSEFVRCQYRIVSSGSFRSMGVPLLQGRTFDDRDRKAVGDGESSMVGIVSTALAERIWPGGDPIGRRLRWSNPGGPLVEVVGVVGEIRDTSLDAESIPTVYFNLEQVPWPSMTLVVKTEGDPAVFASAVRQAVRRVDGGLALPTPRLLASNLAEATAGPRLNAQLIGTFAAAALLIAAIGVYAALSYRVTRSRRDLGIRTAMGAGRRELVRMVLSQGLRLVAIGVAIGVLGSIALTRFLANVLYETSATDPLVFAIAPLLFAVVAASACYLPARRAANVDPSVALRVE